MSDTADRGGGEGTDKLCTGRAGADKEVTQTPTPGPFIPTEVSVTPFDAVQVSSREPLSAGEHEGETKRGTGGRLDMRSRASLSEFYKEFREYQKDVNEEIEILRRQVSMLRRLIGLPGGFHEGKR